MWRGGAGKTVSKLKMRLRQRLGTCKVTGPLLVDDDDWITIRCIRTAQHDGLHQDPDFGPWSAA